jgi:hypothetical protein
MIVRVCELWSPSQIGPDSARDRGQSGGLAGLGRAPQRAVEHDCAQVVVARRCLVGLSVAHAERHLAAEQADIIGYRAH